jgi:hypothetical protein
MPEPHTTTALAHSRAQPGALEPRRLELAANPAAESSALLAAAGRELDFAAGAPDLIALHRRIGAVRRVVGTERLGRASANEWAKLSIAAARKASPLIDELVSPGKPSRDGKVTLASLGVSPSQASRWRKLARLSDLGIERHYARLEQRGEAITTRSLLDLYERSFGAQHPNTQRLSRQARALAARCPTCGRVLPAHKRGGKA